MVVAVAVADLHRHAAVERVGDVFGRRAAFERLCTGHIDDVFRAGRLRHGGDNIGAIEPRDDFAVLFKSGIRNILNFHGFFILAFCFESNHIIPRCRGNCKTLRTQKVLRKLFQKLADP